MDVFFHKRAFVSISGHVVRISFEVFHLYTQVTDSMPKFTQTVRTRIDEFLALSLICLHFDMPITALIISF